MSISGCLILKSAICFASSVTWFSLCFSLSPFARVSSSVFCFASCSALAFASASAFAFSSSSLASFSAFSFASLSRRFCASSAFFFFNASASAFSASVSSGSGSGSGSGLSNELIKSKSSFSVSNGAFSSVIVFLLFALG